MKNGGLCFAKNISSCIPSKIMRAFLVKHLYKTTN